MFHPGHLVFFVNPSMGEGFMFMSEVWGLFLVALIISGLVTAGLHHPEGFWTPESRQPSPLDEDAETT